MSELLHRHVPPPLCLHLPFSHGFCGCAASVQRHCNSHLTVVLRRRVRRKEESLRGVGVEQRAKTVFDRGLCMCHCCDVGSNAGKFTARGVVTVDVTVVMNNDVQYVVVTVSNTRMGKALTDPELLFIPFRGASSR